MTRDDMKKALRARGSFRPEHALLLDTAIDETIQVFWDYHDWSFKLDTDTFTSDGSATYQLPAEVDSILELTYGSNNRVVQPVPHYRLSELYNNISRSGSDTYYYSLNSADPEQITIDLVPTPSSGRVFTYFFRRKMTPGDLGSIPSKWHPLIMLGAGAFLANGDMWSSPSFSGGIAAARDRDKPITHRRYRMGLDPLQADRINRRNTMEDSGLASDPRYPID